MSCHKSNFTRKSSPDSPRGVSRHGKVLVLIAILLVPLFGFTALAVDATYLMHAKKETQIAAEAAALGGVLGLAHPDLLKNPPDATNGISGARTEAVLYASKNSIANLSAQIDRNESNDPNGEIVVGRLRTWSYQNYPWEFDTPVQYNTVKARVKRTDQRNGPIALFFANIFGIQSSPVEAEATVIMQRGAIGFDTSGDSGNTSLIPFALLAEEWEDKVENGNGADDWSYDPVTGSVYLAPDQIPEVTLYPQSFPAGGETGGGLTPGEFRNCRHWFRQ